LLGDADEPVRGADRGGGKDLELGVAERDQLPRRGAGLLELCRDRRGVIRGLDERLVVASAQVGADRRVDDRGHDRQRAEDDHAHGDRDPGAQVHGSSRST
jgi:hypothetical protein